MNSLTGIHLLTVLFALFPGCLHAQGRWESVPLPVNQIMHSIFFTDSIHGYVGGDSGFVLRTRNAGTDWAILATNTRYEVSSIFFTDHNNGWISTQNYLEEPFGTILLRTRDGGDTWQHIPYPEENIFITSLYFSDTLNGWAGGRPHCIAKTTDGGITWHQAAVDTSILAFFPVLSIDFYNEKYGYASGGIFDIAGVIWMTSDSGATWRAIGPEYAPADEVHKLHLFDSLRVIGAGGDPDFGYGVGLMRRSDGGNSWVYDELEYQGVANDLAFRNAREAWAPNGQRRKLMYSLDAGETWTEIDSPGETPVFRICFPDSLHGYGTGRNRAFIRYIPQEVPSVNPIDRSPEVIMVENNHPNPFSQSTTLRFRAPDNFHRRAGEIRVVVYNFLRMKVAEYPAGPFSAGEYNLRFDGSALPSGLYFYRLEETTGGRTIPLSRSAKMVIVR